MKEIAENILERISLEKEGQVFIRPEYTAAKINNSDFISIKKIHSNQQLIFVDGGNAEIFHTPNISLYFNRLYYTLYKNNKRIKGKILEFNSLITTISKSNDLFFQVELFPAKEGISLPKLRFSISDNTLTSNNRPADISRVGDVVRRLAELRLAQTIKEEAIIILDGSLEPKYTYEEEFIDNLSRSKNIICGLSKTSALLTLSGDSLIGLLYKISPKQSWLYKIAESADSYMFCVKLNENSKHIFRLDVASKDISKVGETVSLLSENSKDPIFPGYPYGLIEADKFARVSNREAERLKTQLQLSFGKDYNKIIPYLNAGNAHSILDTIS
ncbi:DNA double-strand break repair nuclease NurA [Candidatus Woesearchaeota archaeon]|nr:DNA double-strand break repair nuclease NurA [Candidatus Woesearchaeota archaeon]